MKTKSQMNGWFSGTMTNPVHWSNMLDHLYWLTVEGHEKDWFLVSNDAKKAASIQARIVFSL